MAAKNGLNIANGFISIIVLACGISFSVFLGCLVKKLNQEGDSENNNYSASSWTYGLVFIVTGLTGIICSFAKKRGGYITHMVFGIIALLVKGAVFIFSIAGFEMLSTWRADTENCITVGDRCVCSSFSTYNGTCENIDRMYSMLTGVLSVVVIGWILTLVTTIFSGILGCKQEVKPGMVIRQPMPTTVVHVPSQIPPQTLYLPQTHDNAKLISNIDY